MSILQEDINKFEFVTSQEFEFLVSVFGFLFAGVSTSEDDPRDSYVVAKYRKDDFRVDVAWNPYAMSLSALIRLANSDLGRKERYLYFEPFLEFATDGKLTPVVPQIYPGMSVAKIERAMENRQQLFAMGVEKSLSDIASRMKQHFEEIRTSSAETIREYQAWYERRGRAA